MKAKTTCSSCGATFEFDTSKLLTELRESRQDKPPPLSVLCPKCGVSNNIKPKGS